ncbi:MAG: hypothetical protein QOF26_277, partial [Baekduia sp.]|nr:hypothetical protein [Baekduia sp.]
VEDKGAPQLLRLLDDTPELPGGAVPPGDLTLPGEAEPQEP